MVQKNLSVLTGGRINEGFFYKTYGRFARRPKKMAVNERGDRKEGFHCTMTEK